jgi:hypothetical protein
MPCRCRRIPSPDLRKGWKRWAGRSTVCQYQRYGVAVGSVPASRASGSAARHRRPRAGPDRSTRYAAGSRSASTARNWRRSCRARFRKDWLPSQSCSSLSRTFWHSRQSCRGLCKVTRQGRRSGPTTLELRAWAAHRAHPWWFSDASLFGGLGSLFGRFISLFGRLGNLLDGLLK